jgi:hypothetical protein
MRDDELAAILEELVQGLIVALAFSDPTRKCARRKAKNCPTKTSDRAKIV